MAFNNSIEEHITTDTSASEDYQYSITNNHDSIQKPTGSAYKLYEYGRRDASISYINYSKAGRAILLTSIVAPFIGLIPAIVSSATPPKMINLNYPSEELYNDPHYRKGYSDQALEIKQRKVWTNWAVGFGVYVIAALVTIHFASVK